MSRPSLAFVGAGRAASGLARAWANRGWQIESVASRNIGPAKELTHAVGAKFCESAASIKGDLVIIAVPDDAIAGVVSELMAGDWLGRGVVHTSGATPVEVLRPLADRGAQIGGLHPAFPFSADPRVVPDLHGVTFAIEAEDGVLMDWLGLLVSSVGGESLTLPPGGRAIYHAALVFASNYTITLIALAQRLLESLGAPEEAAKQALDGLVGGMAESVRRSGVVAALPGPLVRGDAGTIAAHLGALRRVDPDAARLYANLTRATYPILQARGVPYDEITRVLEQENSHAKDST